jgi:hypothetical protein
MKKDINNSIKIQTTHLIAAQSERPPLISDQKIQQLLSSRGYLTIERGALVLTDDVKKAKKNYEATKFHIKELGSFVNDIALQRLNLKLSEDRLRTTFGPMPSDEIQSQLRGHLQNFGVDSTLKLLQEICNAKMEKGERYRSVSLWTKDKSGSFVHQYPKVNPSIPAPSPGKSPLMTMMEPSLEEGIYIEGKKISHAELLLTDLASLKEKIAPLEQKDQEEILKLKQTLDSFYKSKAYFTLELNGKTLLITVPTTRYAQGQYLALPIPNQSDILSLAAKKHAKKMGELSSQSTKGSKEIASYSPTARSQEETSALIEKTKKEVDAKGVMKNITDIRSLAELVEKLPEGSFVAQNSPDTSSDANYQHFQIFTDAPTSIIPLFNDPESAITEKEYSDDQGMTQKVVCSKVDSSYFSGSIFKCTLSSQDMHSKKFLDQIVEQFKTKEKGGCSLNIVGRKIDGHQYEYYIILRKSISHHPSLLDEALKQGGNKPGWAEMAGIRLGKEPQDFEKMPDAKYQNILTSFAAEEREQKLLIDLMKEIAI